MLSVQEVIMLSKLSRSLLSWSKGWVILVLFTVLVGYLVLNMPILQAAPGGDIVALDAQFFYRPETAFGTVASYGDSAPLWSLLYLSWDILTPILYALGFSTLISAVFRHAFLPTSKLSFLNLLPVGAGLFDLLENFSIVSMLSIYPAQPVILAWLSTICTMAKVSLIGGSVLLVLIGLVKIGLYRIQNQGNFSGRSYETIRI